ncbi:cytidine deaminase [Salinisphaera sp. Q1T1-3]|uniref:cytidine deaminase n=1 Tax=Salinisphaera sp. Q1T1-3 TaxID=2321229 RepID=UPI000E7201C0|nr:cytidine deaminase [Salinisphaera sp. Q1T1-3]RJS92417.1 cytidine deaminase [Salinisphaera sp. Q1T1-3]
MSDVVDWDLLVARAEAARGNAHAPYSGFSVGSALWVGDGQVFAGCNVENAAFPSAQCAEASAIGVMISAVGAVPIRAVVVATRGDTLTWPCGNCRQKLAEFAAPDALVMAVTETRRSPPRRLTDLLPAAFVDFEAQPR